MTGLTTHEAAATGADAAPHGPARVLVVDDGEINRRLLGRLLEQDGHIAVLATDGEEALAMLRRGEDPVDVVLLDILMPGIDGQEVLRQIKGDDALRHLPVIMISSLEDITTVIQCIEGGAADYLQKPFNRAVLRARLNATLADKRLRDREMEYLDRVRALTDAAVALESGDFQSTELEEIAQREDPLGHLARVLVDVAEEVKRRERRLQEQVRALTIQIDRDEQQSRVAEITSTDYFRELREQAHDLRSSLSKGAP
ncbi:MAG: response regulator [Dehalococcoidia bacterium]|nr:response regulator [Dehalococcoidia bacterium]